MKLQVVTSIQLSEELANQVNELAELLDHPPAWVIEQAIQRYVLQELSEVRAIKEAVDELHAEMAAGHVEGYDFDEVMNEIDDMIQAKLRNQ
jgi:predicted transcriptional regulator